MLFKITIMYNSYLLPIPVLLLTSHFLLLTLALLFQLLGRCGTQVHTCTFWHLSLDFFPHKTLQPVDAPCGQFYSKFLNHGWILTNTNQDSRKEVLSNFIYCLAGSSLPTRNLSQQAQDSRVDEQGDTESSQSRLVIAHFLHALIC